jgi:FAD dependent oxidoreductase
VFKQSCIGCLVMFAGVLCTPALGQSSAQTKDLVVYGATASGVMTAYSAAQQGLHVVLIEPGTHLGGMVTGSLSATDLGQFAIIGGYARDFYLKAAAHYGVTNLDLKQNWLSEPHVGEEIFRVMLKDAAVQVYFHEQIREKYGVTLRNKRVTKITTSDGKVWGAKVFADCSYEGDLMALAGVTYTWGREGTEQYGESLAGVRGVTKGHQFGWPMSAYDAQHHLYPEVMPGPLAPVGTADKKIEAYNYRLVLTTDPDDRRL